MNAAHIESRLPLMSEIALVKVDMLVFAAAIYFFGSRRFKHPIPRLGFNVYSCVHLIGENILHYHNEKRYS